MAARPLAELYREAGGKAFFSLSRLVQGLAGMCEAVAYAHGQGLCHLEISPEVVLADPLSGDLFLRGGWDRAAGPPRGREEEGAGFLINPRYAAPEQARWPAKELIRRGLWRQADLYGLGGVIYHALYGTGPNGVPPGEDLSPVNLLRALADRRGPPRPGSLRPDWGPDAPQAVRCLEGIARKSLEGDPRKRYGKAEELREDLMNCLRGRRDIL